MILEDSYYAELLKKVDDLFATGPVKEQLKEDISKFRERARKERIRQNDIIAKIPDWKAIDQRRIEHECLCKAIEKGTLAL